MTLAKILSKVTELRAITAAIIAAEEKVKTLKAQQTDLSEMVIPAMMEEAGLRTLQLTDGAEVRLVDEIHPSIPKQTQDLAFEWLRERRLDGIIKRDIALQFPRGQEADADKLLFHLSTHKYGEPKLTDKTHVHPATLKATIKQLYEDGIEVPQDLFGTYHRTVTLVVGP